MQKLDPIEYGNFYHIYNRGINSCSLFVENTNYEYFLKLYDIHISPIAHTYAWVLMKNHFHFLVRIKYEEVFLNLTGFENLSGVKKRHQHFSNLFNAYSKAFNKRYGRHGSLFERPFKRKLVSNPDYLKQLVQYINNNPIYHGIVEHVLDYPWSSYLTCISKESTKTQRNSVIDSFNDGFNLKKATYPNLM
jgi:putative transposase